MYSVFGERLAYARWLRARGLVSVESDRQFAANIGISAKTFVRLKHRQDTPRKTLSVARILRALAPLGVTESWLLDGAGDPPEPVLWTSWRRHMRAGQCRAIIDPTASERRERFKARHGSPTRTRKSA